MPPRIRRHTTIPAYRQVAESIRNDILKGNYRPGEQLPSERDLSAMFDVSRVTIQKSISELSQAGLVYAEHGRGLFVRAAPPTERVDRNRLSRTPDDPGASRAVVEGDTQPTDTSIEIETRQGPADNRTANLLHLAADTDVLVREFLVLVNRRPVQRIQSRIPLAVTEKASATLLSGGPDTTHALLEQLGYTLGPAEEVITARMPTPEEKLALHLLAGTPLLVLTRTLYTSDGKPLEVSDTLYNADRFELAYRLSP